MICPKCKLAPLISICDWTGKLTSSEDTENQLDLLTEYQCGNGNCGLSIWIGETDAEKQG